MYTKLYLLQVLVLYPLSFSEPPFFKEIYLNQYYKTKRYIQYLFRIIVRQAFQLKKLIENPIYVHLENENFLWDGNFGEFPARRETPETREIPESREIPGREKLEAIREGGNRNFPLNIPGTATTLHVHTGYSGTAASY